MGKWSEEAKERASIRAIENGIVPPSQKGIKRSAETKKRMSKAKKGENNPSWKGDNVGYQAIHIWLRRSFGKAKECECNECDQKSKTFQWAKVKGKEYRRRRENFFQLCRSCHVKYDITNEIKDKMSKSAKRRWQIKSFSI